MVPGTAACAVSTRPEACAGFLGASHLFWSLLSAKLKGVFAQRRMQLWELD